MKHHDRLPLAWNPLSRRMLLRGSAAGLAIPFLPSLAARAQAQPSSDRYFLFTQLTHGRHELAWYPQGPTLAEAAPGVRATRLSGIAGRLSPILGGDFDDLRTKISLVQGLDYPSASNNHDMWPFTGSGRVGGSGGAAGESPNFHHSVDTVLSESTKVYPAPVPIPVLRLNPRVGGSSFSFLGTGTNGFAKRAPALGKTLTDTWNAVQRFISIGTSPAPGAGAGPADVTALKRRFLIDQSLAEYRAVVGSAQLGGEDKILLQNYADNLTQVQRRLETKAAAPAVAASCGAPNIEEPADNDTFNQRLVDIMTLAMSCGVTRIATYNLNWESCVSSSGSVGYGLFHDAVHGAHFGGYEKAIGWWTSALKKWTYMVRKLDQLGLLSRSAVIFTSDFSSSTEGHHGVDMPVLTAGTLGGKLRAGEWIDYRNLTRPIKSAQGGLMDASGKLANVKWQRYAGRRINELWTSLFTAAGLTPAEYQRMGRPGFGEYDCMDPAADRCSQPVASSLLQYYRTSYEQPPTATLPYLLS